MLFSTGFQQRFHHGRVAPHAIQRLLDGEHIGIVRSGAQEIDHGLERIVGMMQQNVLPPDGLKDVAVIRLVFQRSGQRRHKGYILQVVAIDVVQAHQVAQPQRPFGGEEIVAIHFQILDQNLAHVRGHGGVDGAFHHDAKAALAHALLHAFQQVHRFQFLDVDVGIADDAERMRFDHFHAGE